MKYCFAKLQVVVGNPFGCHELSIYQRQTFLTSHVTTFFFCFSSRAREYWMLDTWEDDTRRRRRFMRNPYGHSHKEATLSKKDARTCKKFFSSSSLLLLRITNAARNDDPNKFILTLLLIRVVFVVASMLFVCLLFIN